MQRVLLVDDETLVARLYGRAITAAGYQPLFASDAEAAIELIAAEPVDLVLTDLNMPVMSGFDLGAALLEKRLKTMPILLASADDTVGLIAEGLASGLDDFLVKGMSFTQILERVRFWAEGPFRGLPAHVRADTQDILSRLPPPAPPIARLRAPPGLLYERARATFADLLLFAPRGFGAAEADRLRCLGVLDGVLALVCRSNALAHLRRPDLMVRILREVGFSAGEAVVAELLPRLDELTADATFLHARSTLGLSMG
jgi:CheY-like chemotaxis protein